jgi:hypothetical protein
VVTAELFPVLRAASGNGAAGEGTKGAPAAQQGSLVSEAAAARLRETTELDYMTHIVFRMYENKRCGGFLPLPLYGFPHLELIFPWLLLAESLL